MFERGLKQVNSGTRNTYDTTEIFQCVFKVNKTSMALHGQTHSGSEEPETLPRCWEGMSALLSQELGRETHILSKPGNASLLSSQSPQQTHCLSSAISFSYPAPCDLFLGPSCPRGDQGYVPLGLQEAEEKTRWGKAGPRGRPLLSVPVNIQANWHQVP